jgi:hypothetical protein
VSAIVDRKVQGKAGAARAALELDKAAVLCRDFLGD